MDSSKLFLSVLFFLLFLSVAFADGFPLDSYDYHLEEVRQNSQLAYIDFDGQEYDLSLYIEIDFTGNDQEEIKWVVPFKDVPDEIFLEQKTYQEFREEFAEFDQSVERAVELKKRLEEDLFNEIGFVGLLHFIPSPLAIFGAAFFSVFGTLSAGRGDMEVSPVKTYDFGELGSAGVFEVPEGATLEQFFSEIAVSVPPNLEHFKDKKIVVFKINRVREKFGTLAKFRFSNNQEIFYPSSTTKLWQGEPKDYVIKIRAPKDFKLESNLEPNLKINDTQYQYLVFSPTCVGLSGWPYFECRDIINRSGPYFEALISEPAFSDLAALMYTDLEIGVKPEKKPVPLAAFFISFFPPWLIGMLLVWVSWIGAIVIYDSLTKKKSKKLKPKETILFGSYLSVLWTGVNWGLGLLYLGILFVALMGSSLLLLYRAIIFSQTAAMLFPIAVLGGLALIAWLFNKYFIKKSDKFFKFTKGKIRLKDFVQIGVIASILFIVLCILTLNILFIKI